MKVETGTIERFQEESVCVTGGRGSLGSHLVAALESSGAARIVAFDAQPPALRRVRDEGGRVEHIVGSILSLDELERAISGCSVVFHLAALVHVGRSALDSVRYFDVNALGTANVLEACRRSGVQRVVYTSTTHVYGKPSQVPVAESHPTSPMSVYAASKLAGEAAMQGYSAGYGLTSYVARVSNLYGTSLNPETVVGRALEQCAAGGPITLRDVTPVRDFIHADDVVGALACLAASRPGDGCHTVNVSTGRGVSILQMAETLARVADEEGLGHPDVVQSGEDPVDPVPELVVDNRRLTELTGWTPVVSLEEGLRRALKKMSEPVRTSGRGR